MFESSIATVGRGRLWDCRGSHRWFAETWRDAIPRRHPLEGCGGFLSATVGRRTKPVRQSPTDAGSMTPIVVVLGLEW